MNESDESGADELRRVVRCIDYTNEDAFDGLTAEQIIRVVRAVWASGWDMFPDQLTGEEVAYAAEHGKLSDAAMARLDRELV